jgi:hypothetical protein
MELLDRLRWCSLYYFVEWNLTDARLVALLLQLSTIPKMGFLTPANVQQRRRGEAVHCFSVRIDYFAVVH